MLSAIRAAATTRPLFRLARCYSGGHHGMTLKEQCEERQALMDLLPTPEGDFKTKFAEKNRKLNMHLVMGSLLLVAAYFLSLKTKTHWTPDWSLPKDYNIYEVMEQMAQEEAE